MYKSNLEHYLTFWFLDEKKDDHRQICLEERPEEEPRENDILRIQNSNEQIRNRNTKEEENHLTYEARSIPYIDEII